MNIIRIIRAVRASLSRLGTQLNQQPPRREVVFDAKGFAVFEVGTPEFQAEWSRVKEVFACKEDLFSYDEILLGFRYADDGSSWWLSEEDTGYMELLSELERRYPGIRTDWFSEVAFPAFALNRTTLWGAAWQSAEEGQ